MHACILRLVAGFVVQDKLLFVGLGCHAVRARLQRYIRECGGGPQLSPLPRRIEGLGWRYYYYILSWIPVVALIPAQEPLPAFCPPGTGFFSVKARDVRRQKY
jgi:hypothetical protein